MAADDSSLRERVAKLEARIAKLEGPAPPPRQRKAPAKRRRRKRPPSAEDPRPERRSAMAGRRVLITGVAGPLGAGLAARLAGDPGVERVIGVDTRPLDRRSPSAST